MADAFYIPEGADGDGERFESTPLVAGPWDEGLQHGGPPTALVAAVMERRHPRPDARVVRVTAEILGPVPVAPVVITTAVLRTGRSVELLRASLSSGGREWLRLHAWRVRALPDGAPGAPPAVGDGPPPPGPDAGRPSAFTTPWGGYLSAMEWRFVRGDFTEPGPATVWLRMRHPLLPGEDPAPLTRALIAADSGNGVSGAVPFDRWVFINPDLTVYLHRYPAGEWVSLEAATVIDPAGLGLASATLNDRSGRIGRSLQSLYVAGR